MNYGEIQEFFKDFQWIDNIPEDQSARDKICLEAKAALLIEANRDSERFSAFIRNETPQTPANFKTLINKLRDTNIAILIVHHANSENEVRGFQSKMDSFYMTLNLSCDETEPEGDLNEQSRILKYENPREVMGSSQRTPFKIKFDSKKNQWYIVDDIDENHELLQIVNDYKKCRYDRNAICDMLGLQKSAYSERLKKAKEKK